MTKVKVEIYIDGSCSGNPGPIGFAAICPINGKTLKSAGFDANPEATNNQAELRGAICGLKALKRPCDVTFYTDSNCIMAYENHDAEWLTTRSANKELWVEFIAEERKGKHTIKFVKVKGHNGNKYNELADKYAKAECAKARHKLYEND